MPKEPTKPAIKIDTKSLLFLKLLEDASLPLPRLEFKFHPSRKWRADYAWPDHGLILEVEGAVWTHGRHTRGSGFVKDMQKYNAAAMLGFRILRVQPRELCTMNTINMVGTILLQDL